MCKTIFSNLFILTFILFLNNAFAQQTGKIVGNVIDGETNEPIAGANVYLVDTNLGASTDVDGDFFIINVPPGTYNL